MGISKEISYRIECDECGITDSYEEDYTEEDWLILKGNTICLTFCSDCATEGVSLKSGQRNVLLRKTDNPRNPFVLIHEAGDHSNPIVIEEVSDK